MKNKKISRKKPKILKNGMFQAILSCQKNNKWVERVLFLKLKRAA